MEFCIRARFRLNHVSRGGNSSGRAGLGRIEIGLGQIWFDFFGEKNSSSVRP